MKKGSHILLSCIICAGLVSCKKEIHCPQADEQGVERMVQVKVVFAGGNGVGNTREGKSAIYDDFRFGTPDEPFGTVTLWTYLSGDEGAESCVSFNPNEPLPSLWLREGCEYSFIAVSNINMPNDHNGDYTRLSEEEIFSHYAEVHKTPVGNKLPLFARGNIPCATDGSTLSINFSHSWAKILFRIDDTGLNGGYRPTAFKLYKKENGEIIEYDRAASMEFRLKGAAVQLYCPADDIAWNGDEELLPYVEITGNLTGAFAGTVTYRVRIGREKEIFAANQYSYTFKPTLEHLMYKEEPEWEVDDDISISNFSKLKVVADLDHSNYRKVYDEYYPDAWQDLSSSDGSVFTLELHEPTRQIAIPRKWYSTSHSGENLTRIFENETKVSYKTRHLGKNTFVFTTPQANDTLSYTLTTIWQPKIEPQKAIPQCPDSDVGIVHFGTELCELSYKGSIKAPSGSSIVTRTFRSYAAYKYYEDSLLDNCYSSSTIDVPGRSESVTIPIVYYDSSIIYSIQKETQNALWGCATGISITSRIIKYTLPSNNEDYWKYVLPYMSFLSNTADSNQTVIDDLPIRPISWCVYVNGRIFY